MHTPKMNRGGILLAVAMLALAACQGEKGPAGISSGTISGTLTIAGGAPVPSASITLTPDVGVAATSAADGTYALSGVPSGVYTVNFAGPNVTADSAANVSVVAGGTVTLDRTLKYTPITIPAIAARVKTGFDADVPLSATQTGATGQVTYAWTQVSGPTAATIAGGTTASPTIHTGKLEDIANGGKVRLFALNPRPELVALTAQQIVDLAYTFKVTVSDGKYSQSQTVKVTPASWTSGAGRIAVDTMVIGNDAPAASYDWKLTVPTGSTAAKLAGATTRNPTFVPDVAGVYTLTNGATTLTVTADTYSVAVSETCGGCHQGETATKFANAWAEYKQSAHGNFFWKDPTKTPEPLLGAGLDGYASDHYGSACPQCHATGNDPAATNGGFDELAAANGWTFPKTLQPGNYAAIPAAAKPLAAITCQSCHGPVDAHAKQMLGKPAGSFSAETCGYCHDSGTHHDRYALWAQGGHANVELALGEGTNPSCTKCHSAQGFVQWANAGFATSGVTFTAPSAADVQPQTCQACHDPHGTVLRIDASKPLLLEAGFTVQGLGSGMLCVTCHQSRRGLRDDAHLPASIQAPHQGPQADVYMGRNVYFVGTDFSATMSKHAYAVKDGCVGCHMQKEGAATDLLFAPSSTNHSFRVSDELCNGCHGLANAREQVKEQFEVGMANVSAATAKLLVQYMNDQVAKDATSQFLVVAYDQDTDTYSQPGGKGASNVVIPVPAPADVAITDVHGQAGAAIVLRAPLSVTFEGGTTKSYVAGDVLKLQLGTLVYTTATTGATQTGVIAPTSDVNKALWNYLVFESDRSEGAHNPAFVLNVLNETASKLIADLHP